MLLFWLIVYFMFNFLIKVWGVAVSWYGRRTVIIVLSFIIILVFIGLRLSTDTNNSGDDSNTDNLLAEVSVASVTTLTRSSGDSMSLLGTVEAKNQAKLVAERGGRITNITTTLGGQVHAGQVLVTFENAAERAQITQAEGAYQAALASQAQAGTGIIDAATGLQNAQNAALTAFSTSYSTINQIFTSTIDQYYGNPRASIPGIRVSGFGQTSFLNSERVAFESILSTWREESTSLTTTSQALESTIQSRIQTLNRAITLVDTFATILPQQPTNAGTDAETWRQQTDLMVQARNNIIQLRTNLESSLSGLSAAREAVKRAEIGGGSTTSSLASAQLTQALGALQAAEANFNRTIIRAPIAGTVVALPVRVGDNVAPQTLAIELINESALEVITFINQSDRPKFAVGSSVSFSNSGTGIITAIADRIDGQTGKIEVRIATTESSLTPGDTVRIIPGDFETTAPLAEITLPLNAVRFIGDTAHAMIVLDDKLELRAIETGAIRGNRVVVTGGLDADTVIVTDVRGKQVGQRVRAVEVK